MLLSSYGVGEQHSSNYRYESLSRNAPESNAQHLRIASMCQKLKGGLDLLSSSIDICRASKFSVVNSGRPMILPETYHECDFHKLKLLTFMNLTFLKFACQPTSMMWPLCFMYLWHSLCLLRLCACPSTLGDLWQLLISGKNNSAQKNTCERL